MAQDKSSTPGKPGKPGATAASRPARPSGSSKAGTTRPTKSGAAKVNTSRPAGRGPAQRPPARRKKSIVNQKQTPWGFIAAGAAVLVFAIVVVLVVVLNSGSSNSSGGGGDVADQIIPTTPTGSVTKQGSVKRVKNTTGVPGVIAYDTAGYPAAGKAGAGTLTHQHVAGPVDYSITPPVGGPHNAIWMNAGVYTKPVPTERAVHTLEHGAIWITYRPNLSKSDVAKLRAFVGKQSMIAESSQAESGVSGQSNRYMDLTPWASNSLPAPIVISSWGYQLRLQSPTDSRMQKFVDTFRNSRKYTPEFGSAVDGIPVQTGGRPAYYGSKLANPAGSQPGS